MPWVVQCVLAVAVTLVAAVPVAADPITFKLLPNYSRATFKADALLESIVGTTASAESRAAWPSATPT
ncbi:MAG: hypothetical protein HYR86_01610 [Candidatus Rokubacteria bacterium]|nr:hypothetical protein [Candidatus Rokubacteria bacterium]